MSSSPDSWRMMWGAKVQLPCDVPDDVLKAVIDTVQDTMRNYRQDFEGNGDDITKDIKRTLDSKWGEYWHVIMGKNFGSYCTHDANRFIFFYLDDIAVMAFKSG